VDGTGTIKERQTPAPVLGGRFTFWLGSSFGIEAAGSFALSGTRFVSDNATGGAGFSLAGTLITGSGRLLYRPARTNLHLLIGAAWCRGAAIPGLRQHHVQNGHRGVVGFGVKASVTLKFALNIGVESFPPAINGRRDTTRVPGGHLRRDRGADQLRRAIGRKT
jgi:hypothetical protein